MTRHLHIEPVDLVDLLAAEWAQEDRAIASHRATHAPHRVRILGLGHSVGIAIARAPNPARVVKAFCLAVAVFCIVYFPLRLLVAFL